tara:strand:+ start:567 stop:1460 length:894 start_codon:yes stop_codon:yes gene_type:complete
VKKVKALTLKIKAKRKKKINNLLGMKITATEVNDLRKSTGAGMMDCKKALVEANGNHEKAIEILRKKGQKVAANRAERESTEGVVLLKINEQKSEGVIVSLNCETDFVAKNKDFLNFASEILNVAENVNSMESLLNSKNGDLSISDKLIEQTGIIGEKIEIGNFKKLSGKHIGGYVHAGNKIAAMVALSDTNPVAEEVSKNVAMQVAAMNPLALNENSVDSSIVEKETEIIKEQLVKEGRPENIIDNIIVGKLKRFYKDNTLVIQSYIKDSKVSVEDYVKSIDKNLSITSFIRVSLV